MPNYRKPDARKKAAGTFRKDRAKHRPRGVGVAAVPSAPVHLTDAARSEWHRLAPVICEQRTLAPGDLRALEMLVETLATASAAQAVVARDGLTVAAGAAGVRAHPTLKTLEAARAQATRLLIEFGLTPRARGHVDAAPDETPGNAFADL